MKLKKSYNFLYMPDGEGNTRVLRVPRAAILGGVLLLLVLALLATLYFAGVRMGSGWWPDSSELKAENAVLQERVEDLEGEVGAMRVAMDEAFEYQQIDLIPQTAQFPGSCRGQLDIRTGLDQHA